jgi:GntR family transcriptional repressor for pyruvate dehydrogenase complex
MSKPHSRRALWIQRLTNEVSLGVTQQIRDGALPPRAPLPSLEVMPVLSITTHTVIERAQKNPSDTGLIAQAAGGGYCVSASPQPVHECALPDTAPDRLEDVLAILELRLGLEAEGPALAAERRDAHQMAAIKAAAQAHADSTRTTSAAHRRRTGGAQAAHRRRTGGAQADFRFHRAVAEASGTPDFLDLLDYLGPFLIPRMRVPLPVSTAPDAPIQKAMAEHADRMDAIRTQDGDTARRAMRAHLARTMDMICEVDVTGDGPS